MAKLLTLRNIITLFLLPFTLACNKPTFKESDNLDVKTYSSEDKFDASMVVGEIKDPETGKVVIVIKQQQ